MKLKLIRLQFSPKATLGELFIDGKFECYTLEKVVRAEFEPDKTAVPFGTYDFYPCHQDGCFIITDLEKEEHIQVGTKVGRNGDFYLLHKYTAAKNLSDKIGCNTPEIQVC